ncbi:putative actin [Cercophora samala]|uniref:Centractin n=1 Tax=Cercophora samala TaxID=330535 RepID=A0AA39ZJ30_9PEZI|nr:putative actin [Cercophora samala]
MDDTVAAVVIDTGSATTKAGFAGDEYPHAVFPSVVGSPRDNEAAIELHDKDSYVGDEAQSKREILALRHPIEQGIITNWEDVEAIWYHAFYNELHVEPHEHPILMEHAPLTRNSSKEKMTQVIFETFNAPAFHVSLNSSLVLHATGRTTGLVLQSGESVTHAVPVYERDQGLSIPARDAVCSLGFGGRDITDYMMKLLTESGHTFCPTADERDVVRNLKQQRCYAAFDFEEEIQIWAGRKSDPTFVLHEISYELPDGQVINLSNERFRGPEAMFQPSVLGLESGGVHALVVDAIMKCDADIRRSLFGNIVLAGGNTMFPGFVDRLQKEVAAIVPSDMLVRVVATPDRKYLAWVGGSVVASLSTFGKMCISSQEYDEMGPSVVHRKCID